MNLPTPPAPPPGSRQPVSTDLSGSVIYTESEADSNPGRRIVRVTNSRNGKVLADSCKVANSAAARSVGLLNRSSLQHGEGLLIRPCKGVHTFFMRFAIDVLFLDSEGRVLRVYHAMRPWRLSKVVWRSAQVIELPAGTARETDTREGDSLVLED